MTRNNKSLHKKRNYSNIKSLSVKILSHMEFKELTEYERIRSDRNGTIFSILIFHLLNNEEDFINQFIIKLSHMTRSIDRIGWHSKNEIAVLLPDTNDKGSIIFGKKIEKNIIKENSNSIRYLIYCYPDSWLENEEESNIKKKTRSDEFNIKSSIESLFVLQMPLWKRVIDVSGSIFLLVFFSPIFLLLTAYIKTISPGPVFFKQVRIGYKGLPFIFWKFRTMKHNSSETFHGKHSQSFIKNGDIPMEKLDKKDSRIFIGGRVIRKSCMDELPQLFNVLKGEMSLVGPRPCIPYEAKEYLRWHTHRFDTVPGLSGLWQVSGKNKLTFKQMIRLDIIYSQNLSFHRDLFILFKTPYAIFKMITESIIYHVVNRPNSIQHTPHKQNEGN